MDKVWGNDKLTLNQIRGNEINYRLKNIIVDNPRKFRQCNKICLLKTSFILTLKMVSLYMKIR